MASCAEMPPSLGSHKETTLHFMSRVTENYLSCPICFEVYHKPKMLPCGHTYCLQCIVGFVGDNQHPFNNFRCPLCRSNVIIPPGGLESLPSNLEVSNIAAELQSFQDTLTMQDSLSASDHCQEHPDQDYLMYCTMCNQCVCTHCIESTHYQHGIKTIHQAKEDVRIQIMGTVDFLRENILTQSEQMIQALDAELVNLDGGYADTVHKIRSRSQLFHELVRELEEENLIKANEIQLASTQPYHKAHTDIQQQLHIFNQTSQTIHQICQEDRPVKFLEGCHDVNKTLELLKNYQQVLVMPEKKHVTLFTGDEIQCQKEKLGFLIGHFEDVDPGTGKSLITTQPIQSADVHDMDEVDLEMKRVCDLSISCQNDVIAVNGEKLKILSHPGGIPVIHEVKLPITYVCVYREEIYALASHHSKLYTLSLNGNILKEEYLSIQSPHGIAIDTMGNLFVASHDQSIIYKKSSRRLSLKSIVKGHSNYICFTKCPGRPENLCSTQNNGVIAVEKHECGPVDWVWYIRLYNKQGQNIWSSDKRIEIAFPLADPSSVILRAPMVCCNAVGFIFIADSFNGRVHKLSPDGTFYGYLATEEEDGIERPTAAGLTSSNKIVLACRKQNKDESFLKVIH